MSTNQLRAANQSLYDSCTTDLIKTDQHGHITSISNSLCTLLGMSQKQVCSHRFIQSHCTLLYALLCSDEYVEFESHDGNHYHFRHLQDKDHATGSCCHIFTNISAIKDLSNENQRLKEEARQLQLIDPGTSLLTYRALLLILESQVSHSRRYATPLSILVLKLNSKMNAYGHRVQMQKISRVLKDQLRWSDLIARSDTHSFTIILPETDLISSQNLLNKLRAVLSVHTQDLPIDCAVVTWDKNFSSVELLEHCQQQLSSTLSENHHRAVC